MTLLVGTWRSPFWLIRARQIMASLSYWQSFDKTFTMQVQELFITERKKQKNILRMVTMCSALYQEQHRAISVLKSHYLRIPQFYGIGNFLLYNTTVCPELFCRWGNPVPEFLRGSHSWLVKEGRLQPSSQIPVRCSWHPAKRPAWQG